VNNENLTVKTNRTAFSTDYFVTGPTADVNAWCENLKKAYHPCGYGTFARLHEDHGDGTVTAQASRANSCD
jgi:hypothetical protein